MLIVSEAPSKGVYVNSLPGQEDFMLQLINNGRVTRIIFLNFLELERVDKFNQKILIAPKAMSSYQKLKDLTVAPKKEKDLYLDLTETKKALVAAFDGWT